jgi:hypothetical protein
MYRGSFAAGSHETFGRMVNGLAMSVKLRGEPGQLCWQSACVASIRAKRMEAVNSPSLAQYGEPSAGQDGPPLYPGPLCGGELGATGRAAGIDRDVDAFSPGQESGRKARPQLTDLPPMDGRRAPSGVSFSLGYFSF